MKIPNKLKIGGHTFKIKLVEKNELGEENLCGLCDLDTSTISISKSLTVSHQEATLFHEVMHAMNWSLDEEMIESISQQFYQVLTDNKLLK